MAPLRLLLLSSGTGHTAGLPLLRMAPPARLGLDLRADCDPVGEQLVGTAVEDTFSSLHPWLGKARRP